MQFLLTFSSTQQSIQAESSLLKKNVPVKVMPVPQSIRAGCGLALRVDFEYLLKTVEELENKQIEYSLYRISGSLRNRRFDKQIGKALCALFGIGMKEQVCIVGCGGKTSLLYALGDELKDYRILMGTTTNLKVPLKNQVDKLYVLQESESSLEQANMSIGRTMIAEKYVNDNKIHGMPDRVLNEYGFDLAILECDGSRVNGSRD